MPMRWLQKDRLKLVGRLLYQESDQAHGIKLNSRYAPLPRLETPPWNLMEEEETSIMPFIWGSITIFAGKE